MAARGVFQSLPDWSINVTLQMKTYIKSALIIFVVLFLFIFIKIYVVKRDYFGENYGLGRIKQDGIPPKYITEENDIQKQLGIRRLKEQKVSVGVRKGKIALVLDDWGYNMRNWQALSRIKEPLTISVLPDLPYSTKIATFAQAEGYEVILHLPLESYEHKNMERNTIYRDMEENKIQSILDGDFLSVPKAAGVSNHMGSRATEDERVMKIIFEAIKEKDIFFLDSLVTEKSLCENLAKEAGIKFTERDVFLDNVNDKNYIRKQLMELVRLACSSGRPVVGIGHARSLTLEVLEEEIEHLAEQGIEFVYLSEAVK